MTSYPTRRKILIIMCVLRAFRLATLWHTLYVFFIFSWWRHQTFSALLAICAGNSPVPVNSPHKGQWSGALMFSLICTWIKGWVNNREAGDLRRHSANYDVIVMLWRQAMEKLSVLLAVCASLTIGLPMQRVTNTELWWFFVLAWISCWTNSRVTGDSGRLNCHVMTRKCWVIYYTTSAWK